MSEFPKIPNDAMLKLLEPPTGEVSMVLDTDTYNEIDDQFAVVYAIMSEKINVEALYAAPFHNSRSSGPGDGMEKSYEEILRLLERLSHPHEGFVFRGSKSYLPGPGQPVESIAAADLIERAMAKRDGLLRDTKPVFHQCAGRGAGGSADHHPQADIGRRFATQVGVSQPVGPGRASLPQASGRTGIIPFGEALRIQVRGSALPGADGGAGPAWRASVLPVPESAQRPQAPDHG